MGDVGPLWPSATPPDLRFLNLHAWNIRWQERAQSRAQAERVLHEIKAQTGEAALTQSGLAFRTLAWQARWRGDYRATEKYAKVAFDHLRQTEAPDAKAELHVMLGLMTLSQGRRDLSREHLAAGFELVRETGQSLKTTEVDLRLLEAILYRYAEQMDEASRSATAALDLADARDAARVHCAIAKFGFLGNDPHDLLGHGMQALVLARRYRIHVILPYALETVGLRQLEIGQWDRADKSFAEGFQIGSEDGDASVLANIRGGQVHLARLRGDPDTALALARSGLDIAMQKGFVVCAKRFLRNIAEISDEARDSETAARAWKELFLLKESERA